VFALLLAPAYFAPLRRFAAAYHQRQEAAAAAEILAPLTRRSTGPEAVSSALAVASGTPALAVSPAGAPVPAFAGARPAPDVALRDVTVRFPGRPSPALRGVSLFVPARGVVGVVGPSGSGKSTLLKVAGGWLAASDGEALTGGHPAGNRRALLIGQHPYLFFGSLADNVSLGRPGISRERISQAIEAAQLSDLAARLPDGLDTILGERGWGISGGEAQRLALARAFASDASLILVDEPTAHLDAATEAALIEPLRRLLGGRTALVATHSDAILEIVDRVITMDGGQIRG
jgi:ATP-binding cassette subfamily C protein CydD